MGICIFDCGVNMKSFQQTHRMARNGFFEPVFPNPGMGSDVWIWAAQPGAAPCCVGRGSWCLLSALEKKRSGVGTHRRLLGLPGPGLG